MNNEDLIDEWDKEDYEVFNQWDEEAKNKRLEELEEYFKSDMEIRAKLLTRIDRLNYSLEQANKEIERLNNIINELEKWLNEEYDATIFDYQNAIEDVLDKLQELKGSDKE